MRCIFSQWVFRQYWHFQARYITQYPYCGAFQPPPESGLSPSYNSYATGVTVNPPVDNHTVFECKYEIDSLCGFLKLSRSYYQTTNDSSIMNDKCMLFPFALWSNSFVPPGNSALEQIFRVIDEQSQGTFDENYNVISYYNWTGGPGALSPAVVNEGNGEPKAYTGLVVRGHYGFLDWVTTLIKPFLQGTHHRPSDDISTFGAFVFPQKFMLCPHWLNITW